MPPGSGTEKKEVGLVSVRPVLRSPCDHPYTKSGNTGRAMAGQPRDPSNLSRSSCDLFQEVMAVLEIGLRPLAVV